MTRRRALLLVLAFAALQTAAFPGQWFGAEGDEALYVLLARGIVGGRYSLGIFPGEPLFSEVTPGWPLFLSPAALVSGDSPFGYQVWSLLWLAACDGLLFLWLKRRMGSAQAAALTALFALNPLVLSRAGVVMPEIPGLALVLAALLMVDRPRPAGGVPVGMVLVFAYLVRPALLPLAIAVPVSYWLRGLRRDAVSSGAFAFGAWGAWRLWAQWAGGFSDLGEGMTALRGAGLSLFPSVFAHNLGQSISLWGGTMTPGGGPPPLSAVSGAVLALLAAFAVIKRVRRKRDAAGIFLAGSAAMHLAWPWWYERYLPPLLPFLILGAWEGALRLGVPRKMVLRGAVLLALIPLPRQGAAVIRRSQLQTPPMAEAHAFLKSLPPDRLVVSAMYARDCWYSGRPVLPFPNEGASLQALRIGWVLWTPTEDLGSSLGEAFPAARALGRWRERLAGDGFRPVFSGADGTVVFEVLAGTKVTPPRP